MTVELLFVVLQFIDEKLKHEYHRDGVMRGEATIPDAVAGSHTITAVCTRIDPPPEKGDQIIYIIDYSYSSLK